MTNVVPVVMEGYKKDIDHLVKCIEELKLKHHKAAKDRVTEVHNFTVRREDLGEFLSLLKPLVREGSRDSQGFKWSKLKSLNYLIKKLYKLFGIEYVDFSKIKSDKRLWNKHCKHRGENPHMYILPVVGTVKDHISIDVNGNEIENF